MEYFTFYEQLEQVEFLQMTIIILLFAFTITILFNILVYFFVMLTKKTTNKKYNYQEIIKRLGKKEYGFEFSIKSKVFFSYVRIKNFYTVDWNYSEEPKIFILKRFVVNKNDYFNISNCIVSFSSDFWNVKRWNKKILYFKNYLRSLINDISMLLYVFIVCFFVANNSFADDFPVIISFLFIFFVFLSTILHFLKYKKVFSYIKKNHTFLEKEIEINIKIIKRFLIFKMIMIFPSIARDFF